MVTILLGVILAVVALALAVVSFAFAKQRKAYDEEQNAMVSSLNNEARERDNEVKPLPVEPLSLEDICTQKDKEIAGLKKEMGIYFNVGKALKNLVDFTSDCVENVKYAFGESNENIPYEDVENILKSIVNEEETVISELPNYYPEIEKSIDCEVMEEVGEELNYGTVTRVVEPGKRCGAFVVRKAKVKTERRIQK